MSEMTTVWESETHEPVLRLNQSGQGSKADEKQILSSSVPDSGYANQLCSLSGSGVVRTWGLDIV